MGLGESAFKKAINTREHRERAQPASRAKLGLLEKKKDYIQRARDYHRKRDTIKALKIRASNRNPDEFNFGMIRSRVVDGRHIQNWTEKKKSLPADMLKLMKTQDVSYISMQIKSNQKVNYFL
jgi:U3 small nucleolar RNA-associated protein 11